MSLEKTMRSNVVKILRKAGLDARPVENTVDVGFPDVEYIGGLIELKAVDDWPKKPETPVRIDHYSQEQRIWHERRHNKGGRIHVLIQVRSEYLLFGGLIASQIVGLSSQQVLRQFAHDTFPSLADLTVRLPQVLKEAK